MFIHYTFVRSYHIFQPKVLSKKTVTSLPTHELLQSLGFVRPSQSGLVHWLPMGLRSLNKIENIIRHRMNEENAIEVSLSTLSPKTLWERTGRWSNNELFKLKDAKKADYCLSATCEEDITTLLKSFITSYKDMPLLVYQITRKYRDELRPRGGLLRGREFLMKDAYSFASSKEEAMNQFEKVNAIYDRIFTDLKLPFISAWADSGDIGGDLSKEYHYVHKTGEDILLTCNNCGESSNIEKCESFPEEEGMYIGDVTVKYALTKDHTTLICLYFPTDRQLSWSLAMEAMDHDLDLELKNKSNDEVLTLFQEENDEMTFSQVLRVMDCRLNSRSNFPAFPLRQYMKNNFGQIKDMSLVQAEEHEICGACNKGHLTSSRTIEVGHNFYLGTKYSEPLEAKFTDRNNNHNSIIEMGCYGIGVSRLVGAIAEITRDERGLRWPRSVAPYAVSVCMASGTQNGEILSEIKKQFESAPSAELRDNIMYSFNEKLGLGARINLSHALGIPLCVIVGPKNWPKVEIEVRGKIWNRDASSTWKKDYEKYKYEYEWELIENPDGIPKHIVPVSHLTKILTILLKDL